MHWVTTWNDSTLPQWLLDRSILTTNTLQTTTCHIFGDGRFWAWEGIGCCPGTCAHVWHYAQGVARLFPDLERNLREVTDYGVAINPDGSIRFRAEAANTVAIDSQTGIILRTWREHLVSSMTDFLKRVWPGAKRALDWLVRFDENGRGGLDGLLDGKQHNTLDAEWYGKVHCLCSLYLAALRAGQEMALAMGDTEFAAKCGKVHAMGAEKIATLFNGEFYIQEEDPAHAKAIGVGQGCYIDQVIGQWWAAPDRTRPALRCGVRSATPCTACGDITSCRKSGASARCSTRAGFTPCPGEAGLIMCTWPKGGLRDDFKKHWQYAYFNECMSGFEWQAAAHMMQEGTAINAADFDKTGELLENPDDPRSLTTRGLAVGRAIHDRYSPRAAIPTTRSNARITMRAPMPVTRCFSPPADSPTTALRASSASIRKSHRRISRRLHRRRRVGDLRAEKTTRQGMVARIKSRPWLSCLLNEIRLPWLAGPPASVGVGMPSSRR